MKTKELLNWTKNKLLIASRSKNSKPDEYQKVLKMHNNVKANEECQNAYDKLIQKGP